MLRRATHGTSGIRMKTAEAGRRCAERSGAATWSVRVLLGEAMSEKLGALPEFKFELRGVQRFGSPCINCWRLVFGDNFS